MKYRYDIADLIYFCPLGSNWWQGGTKCIITSNKQPNVCAMILIAELFSYSQGFLNLKWHKFYNNEVKKTQHINLRVKRPQLFKSFIYSSKSHPYQCGIHFYRTSFGFNQSLWLLFLFPNRRVHIGMWSLCKSPLLPTVSFVPADVDYTRICLLGSWLNRLC